MNNYEYIIASLPVLSADFRDQLDYALLMEQIREQLSPSDAKAFDMLLRGFQADELCADFYKEALKSKSGFLRGYFEWDLNVRNCKVEYLNNALGRAQGTDIVLLDPENEQEEFPQKDAVMAIFEGTDILARERALDDLMWEKIDSLTELQVFSLDVILAFTAKLQIVSRWLRLDEQAGRELFARLVDEIRNNKKPIE